MKILPIIDDYFDWLLDQELKAHEANNRQAADAMARASSELGTRLVEGGVYQKIKPSQSRKKEAV
jgi:hypothetical protein